MCLVSLDIQWSFKCGPILLKMALKLKHPAGSYILHAAADTVSLKKFVCTYL